MNKYDELIERAKRFTDTAIVGELINAVSELKDREDVVHCEECRYVRYSLDKRLICAAMTNPNWVSAEHFCSYGERKEND